MRRVLSVIHTSIFGGPHNQMLQLYQPLREAGWDTVVVLPQDGGSGMERLHAAGIPIITLPLHRLRRTFALSVHGEYLKSFHQDCRSLRHIIRQESIDVVQVCGLMNPQGAIAAVQEERPVVWQLLGTTAPLALRMALAPLVRALATVVMTTGHAIARAHPGLGRLNGRLIPFFPPVDTGRFSPSASAQRERVRRELGVTPDEILVGTVGNFNLQKAHHVLVEAAPLILKQFPSCRFRILGGVTASHAQYFEERVVRRAAELGLLADSKFKILSPGERIAELVSAFDIFVLTSDAEGVPTAMLEAMASGVPVVATDVGAVGEAVSHERTGLLTRRRSPRATAAAISRLASSPKLRSTIADAALAHARRHFDVTECARTHSQAYSQALAGGPRARWL